MLIMPGWNIFLNRDFKEQVGFHCPCKARPEPDTGFWLATQGKYCLDICTSHVHPSASTTDMARYLSCQSEVFGYPGKSTCP